MSQCKAMWKVPGEMGFWCCTQESGHKGRHRDDKGREFFKPPYPEFCRHPNKCVNGRCESEFVCND